ncbi:MAG: SocA family protein [Deltaproteobacteria bacterium]|nr:SocA family protein [Deltaproteobacteria bacterium]
MRFRFNERKAVQAAAYILKLAGGHLSYMVLLKLLYLADREMLLKHGLTITGDTMIAMKHGPTLSRVSDLIHEGPQGAESAWPEYIGEPSNFEVALKKDGPLDELSRFELGLLKHAYETYGKMDKWALTDLLHRKLPEWKDPGNSCSTIDPADILRAESRSDDEIRQVQEDAEELWFLGSATP